jgi:Flp pilus assembly protein TadG
MKRNRLFRSESGQAIAEAAILLPVFVFVAFAIIDIGWMTRTAAVVEYVVTESARCEAIHSPACTAPTNVQAYAIGLAGNLRLDTGADLQVATPACSPSLCTVSVTYRYKALGAWFPRITITRTASAAVAPVITSEAN